MQEPDKYKKLKIVTDIVSAICLGFLLYVAPVWAVYEPDVHDSNGRVLIGMKLTLIAGTFSIFGSIWLLFRYLLILKKKYPFTATYAFKILLISPGFLLAMLLMILRS